MNDGARAISRITSARTRSISPENPDGAKGGGGRAVEGTGARYAEGLGPGWKISPSVVIEPGETYDMAAIDGAGLITHLWMTLHRRHWRSVILRAYWDGDGEPAIEVPIGDFFGQGWCEFAQLSSAMIASNPYGGLNSYWPMPFRRGARLTLQNSGIKDATVYYQVTYEIDAEPDADNGYLHTQFHRSNPLRRGDVHPIVDAVGGSGHYAGTYLAWGSNSPGWWGEGEIKFYLDDDDEFPTICGTGTEDYVGGAWDFEVPGQGYTTYSTPYLGLHQVIEPDGLYASQQRFGMYRWHVTDPIRFAAGIRVDIQALGWQPGPRYQQLADDIASVAYLYLDRTSAPRPALPSADELDVFGTPWLPET